MPKKIVKPDSSLLRYQLAQFAPDRFASLLDAAQHEDIPRNPKMANARAAIQIFTCKHGLDALFEVFESMSKEQAA